MSQPVITLWSDSRFFLAVRDVRLRCPAGKKACHLLSKPSISIAAKTSSLAGKVIP